MSQLDFKALFSAVNAPILVLDEKLVIVAYNQAYVKATGMRESESVGLHVFAVFPSNPDDERGTGRNDLQTSLERVLATGVEDAMPIIKFDVPIRDSATGEFEERYWKPVNTPLLNSEGRVTHILHRAEDVTALRTSETDLIDNLESMSDGFFSVDKNWNITRVNRVMEETTGLPREKLIGQNHLKLFFADPELHKTNDWTQYHLAMRDRVAASYEDYYAPLKKWNLVRLFPKRDGGLAVFFTDITATREAEKRLREAEENYRAITEATPLIVWTSSTSGAVEYANPKWYEFSGLTEEETLGSGFTSIIHPDDVANTIEKFGESLTLVKPLEIEHRFKRASDGMYRWFLTRALPSFDENGKAKKWFGTNIDVHEQKLAAVELKISKDEAERANQLKSAFLANMSHEIRTPLGAILGFNDLQRDPGVTAGERANYVNIIARNGAQLSVIIDDILDLSKVEAGHLTLEYTEADHKKIGADVLSLLQVKANEKDLALEYSSDPSTPDSIVSDPTRVRQILLNLASNAIKFTKFGSVKIRTYGCKTDAGKKALCFEISDTGIGLNEAQKSKLFQNFSQADETTTRRFGGTGLGLALSRHLARALGGDITITRSEENVGTTFLVKIADQPEKRTAPEDRFKIEERHVTDVKENALEGLKILVVDDAPDNQQLIWRYLTRAGAVVESAENGQLGYRAALNGNFDLVLMDIQMPVMDGYTATAKLREAGYRIPIIALTAHAMNDIRKKALNVGYTDHLTKPIDAKILINTIYLNTRS